MIRSGTDRWRRSRPRESRRPAPARAAASTPPRSYARRRKRAPRPRPARRRAGVRPRRRTPPDKIRRGPSGWGRAAATASCRVSGAFRRDAPRRPPGRPVRRSGRAPFRRRCERTHRRRPAACPRAETPVRQAAAAACRPCRGCGPSRSAREASRQPPKARTANSATCEPIQGPVAASTATTTNSRGKWPKV